MADIARKLDIQTEAALNLLDSMRAILGNDEEMIHDAIEGQTNLIETISAAIERVAALGTFMEAIGEQKKRLDERCARFDRQRDLLRTAVLTAMEQTGQAKLELPQATVSVAKVPVKVEIVSESDIPSRFWVAAAPKLDKKAVLAALKDKETVPGAQLSLPMNTLQVRLG